MRKGALLLLTPVLLGGCGGGSAPSEATPPVGLVFHPGTPPPGSTLTIECPLDRCGTASLGFSVSAVAASAVPSATVQARLLDSAANECAFGFAPRQDVAAGQATTFTFSRVLVSEDGPDRLACRPPFTTTTVDMTLLDAAGNGVERGQAAASYTFALPPSMIRP